MKHILQTSFLNEKNFLLNFQFGFRNKHSINLAINCLKEMISSALDNHRFTCGVFIDPQKAFDTVGNSSQ